VLQTARAYCPRSLCCPRGDSVVAARLHSPPPVESSSLVSLAASGRALAGVRGKLTLSTVSLGTSAFRPLLPESGVPPHHHGRQTGILKPRHGTGREDGAIA